MAIKQFFSDLKDFGWYLLTEPFHQMKQISYHFGEIINRTKSIVYISAILAILFFILKRKNIAMSFFVLMLVGMLLMEWQSGFFRHRRRERTRKQMEEKNNGIDGNN